MSHLALLAEIAARGLTLAAAGDDLRLQGPRDRIDAELVARIRAGKAELIAHLASSAPPELPLTGLQRSYLFGRGELFELGNVASHVYHEIEGSWDVDRLAAGLRAVVARHGLLRSHFTATGARVERPEVEIRIERTDLRGLDTGEVDRRRRELREAWSHRMLPLEDAPLLAVAVTLLDDRMVLHVSHDGLVMDGVSMFLFFRDWWAAYQDPAVAPGPAAGFSFEAYTRALATARSRPPYERSRTYWLDRLDELAPHPDLPLRTSPATVTAPRFSQHPVRLDPTRWASLKQRSTALGLTPSALLLAGYVETLAAWGAGDRFTLLTTFADRPPIHPGILEAIGAFSDTMLVEASVDRSVSFLERTLAVQARLRRDLDHRHFSGGEVLRELARQRGGVAEARIPFTFNSTLGYPVEGLDGSTLELFGPEVFTVSQTPQIWLNVFAMEQHGGLLVQLDGVAELFPAGLLPALAEGYQRLLDGLLDDPDGWAATGFDLLPAEQRARRRAANDTATALPDALLPAAFLDRARRDPAATAIVTSAGEISYGELHRRAARVAGWLRERGVGRDELVGLVMSRGPEQIVGVLGTLLAGAAYLPVDAGLPAQRQEYMLRDGRVRCVLTNTDWRDTTGDLAVLGLDVTGPVPTGPAPELAPLAGANPDDLAYVLYTSGTTGQPKGVMITHRSVANVVADCNTRFGVGPTDRFFGISAFNFDLSVYDIFGSLSAGAAIVMPEHDRAMDPRHWLDLCGTAGVTVWNSVPAIAALLHEQARADGGTDLAALRLVMLSGDRIPPELPATLRRLRPALAVVSLGGPTETTIWNILHPVRADEDGAESIPYGRPNANNRAYVLDEHGRDLPDWVTGEICAAGFGLARGYWGDEARTAERFHLDPARGERIYRTGDLGRYLPSGEIDIQGRRDFQIKVNGYRIEAGEVETRLVGLDGIARAVVVRQEGATGDRLVAHLVPTGPTRLDDAVIRERLRQLLPEYMVPSLVVWHDELPLTGNGKVDRNALTASVPVPPAESDRVGAALDGEVEHWIAELWRTVLGTPTVDAVRTLYELGGDSISAARILTAVRKEYGVSIPIHRLSEVDTVRSMAKHVCAVAGEQGDVR